ncbi:MAG: QcrA and Rieske domain-containing protein [Planctomycetota bacterium]
MTSENENGNGSPTRRRFLAGLAATLGLVALAEVAWIALAFMKPRRRRRGAVGMVVAGPVDRFAPGSVTAFPEGRFYLARLKDGGFLALDRTCTHLGCTVPWVASQQRFVCPCHASAFDIRGDVLSPPAPRALDLLPVRIENGIVKVETGRPIRRQRFRRDQVTRA